MEIGISGGVLTCSDVGGVLPQEIWSSEACRRCRDVEEFASRALEMRCRRRDIEVWNSGALAYGCCCWNF